MRQAPARSARALQASGFSFALTVEDARSSNKTEKMYLMGVTTTLVTRTAEFDSSAVPSCALLVNSSPGEKHPATPVLFDGQRTGESLQHFPRFVVQSGCRGERRP